MAKRALRRRGIADHSPGPWELSRTGDGKAYIITGAADDYWVNLDCEVDSDDKDGDVAEANAFLVAAAPDYFAGVEQMLLHEQCGGDGWWKGWEMLKAAHAKATGS